MANIVSNVDGANDIPLLNHDSTVVQVYRNTDNKLFIPTTMIFTNRNTTQNQMVRIYDEDDSDTEGDTGQARKYLDIWVNAGTTVIFTKEDLDGMQLKFMYGITGLLSTTDATGVSAQVFGREVTYQND